MCPFSALALCIMDFSSSRSCSAIAKGGTCPGRPAGTSTMKALGADLDPAHSLEPCPAELRLDQPESSQPSDTWTRKKYSLSTTELWNGFVKQHYCDSTLCLSCSGHGDLSLLKAVKWAHFSFTPGPLSLNVMKSTWVLEPERCRSYPASPSCWLSS